MLFTIVNLTDFPPLLCYLGAEVVLDFSVLQVFLFFNFSMRYTNNENYDNYFCS